MANCGRENAEDYTKFALDLLVSGPQCQPRNSAPPGCLDASASYDSRTALSTEDLTP
jgi:hypothetical protein